MDALPMNHSLQTLRFWRWKRMWFAVFVICFVSNDTIEHLVLRYGGITADGIIAIGYMLSNNSTLTSLAMNWCRFNDDEAVALSESFKLSQSLDSLDLSRNSIENRGAAAVADFVSSSLIIKRLDLAGNNIGDDGFFALKRALKRNVSLEELFLTKHDCVSDRGMRAILDGVKAHPPIKNVRIAFLSNTLHQDELNFYLERNKGPKRISHANLPQSIWPLVLKRADDCRDVDDRLRAPDLLYYFVTRKCELFTRTRGPSSRKRKRKRNNA